MENWIYLKSHGRIPPYIYFMCKVRVLRKYMLFQFNIQVESANHLWYPEVKYVRSTQEGVTKSTYPLDIFDSDLLCKENLSTNFLFESSWGRQKKNTFFLRVALWAKVVQNTAYLYLI